MSPDRYRRLLDRSGRHCECDTRKPSRCGEKPHKSTGHRCQNPDRQGNPLVVMPLDPELAEHQAVGLGDRQLIVMCRPCATARTGAVRRARESANTTAMFSELNSLFTL
ncbi:MULTISPECIES: hypothetical protein [unclassified Streptomyces]|uniref:hypothetical protein n=1 Tax=unclassified Streptomyces TaxID=2593676 RepID=UPI000DC7DAFC|nr:MULTISPECIES: hypothetical protein [unclassified Streptomyces]AWZ07717.1 hypothetical protein DRB89_27375 [Streptomyces sp. ICC4]AWZ12638.1 hypothetical protein DRB96_10245 [Streptomyces sp. ICC1]